MRPATTIDHSTQGIVSAPRQDYLRHAPRRQRRPSQIRHVILPDPPTDHLDDLPRFLRRGPDRDTNATCNDAGSTTLLSPAPSLTRFSATVILPFAAGYFVSYLFRSINAVMAGPLTGAFDIGPAGLGLMTSIYFLVGMLAQLPASAAIDRYGPRRTQAALMVVAAGGAAIFSSSENLGMLVLGRVLIGIGGSVALLAGLKAVILWGAPQRIALGNGWLVMLGTLGAVTATYPVEQLTDRIGWRYVFLMLAVLCLAIAALILAVVPERAISHMPTHPSVRFSDIYRDPRFWRVAPLSATMIAASWSLQGLWAAHWMRDVEGLTQSAIVNGLLAMAIALSTGAFALGAGADRLRRRGTSSATLLAVISGVSMAGQAALAFQLPLPTSLAWTFVALAGAATVLSFANLAETFPEPQSARVIAALDLLHVGGAFAVQWGFGSLVQLWPLENGAPPLVAYQTALGILIMIQGLGLLSFLMPPFRLRPKVFMAHHQHRCIEVRGRVSPRLTSLDRRLRCWVLNTADARTQAHPRFVAVFGSLLAVLVLVASFSARVLRQPEVRHLLKFAPSTRSAGLRRHSTTTGPEI
jgi:predicted MFS family arabinose efflux permease